MAAKPKINPSLPAQATENSRLVRSHARANETLVRGFEHWLRVRNWAASTRANYVKTIGVFQQFLGSRSAAEADLVILRCFMAQRSAKGAGPHQLNHCRYALRAFYKFLVLAGVVRSSPAQFLQAPKLPHRLPRCCSESETEKLLAAAESPRDKALLELLYASGLRAAEAAALRVEDLDLKAGTGTLRVCHGKGDKERVGFFGSKAAAALHAYLAGRESGPVFLARSGRHLSPRAIGRIVRCAATRAELAGVHPHTLRHSFATHLFNRGVDLRYLQEFLGHARVSTTQVYTHVAIADLQRVHARCHPRGDTYAEV